MAKLVINDFSGGITDLLINTNPNQCEKCENLLIEKDKSLKTRFGCDLYNSVWYQPVGAKRIDGMFYYPLSGLIYFQAENQIYNYVATPTPCGTKLSTELVTSGTFDPTLVNTFLPAAVNTTTEYITITAHGLLNNDPVEFTNSGGGLPNPLAVDTVYYVVGKTNDTFQVSATYGGGAINLTTQGTGTHSAYKCANGWTGIGTGGWEYLPATDNIRKGNASAGTLSTTFSLANGRYYLLSFTFEATIDGDSMKVSVTNSYIRDFINDVKANIYPTMYSSLDNTYYYVIEPYATGLQTLSFWHGAGVTTNYTIIDNVSVKQIIDDALDIFLGATPPINIDTDIMREQQIIVSSKQKRGVRFAKNDRPYDAITNARAFSLGLPKPSTPTKASSISGSNAYLYRIVHWYKYSINGCMHEILSAPSTALEVTDSAIASSIAFSGNTHNGTAVIDNINTGVTNWPVGAVIDMVGVPVGSTILTIASSSSITVSANSTATATVYGNMFAPCVINLPAQFNNSGGNSAWDWANIQTLIYRTTGNGSVYYLVNTVTQGTTLYTDIVNDEALVTGPQLYSNLTNHSVTNDEPPLCKYVTVANDMAWYGDVYVAPVAATAHTRAAPAGYLKFRIQQSQMGDLNSCPANFYVDVEGTLKGLSSIGKTPIALTDNRIYRLDGYFDETGNGQINPVIIDDKAGCIGYKSIVRTRDLLYWAGNYGFFATDGFTVKKISFQLEDTYYSLIDSDNKKIRLCGSYDKKNDRIYWATYDSTSSDNNMLYVYDITFGAFTTISPPASATYFGATTILFSEDKLIRCGQDVDSYGIVYKHYDGKYTDVCATGTTGAVTYPEYAIEHTYRTIKIDYGDPTNKKWVPKFSMTAEYETNATLTLLPNSYDNSSTSARTLQQLVYIKYGTANYHGITETLPSDYVTSNEANAIIKSRHFTAGCLRTKHKQLELTNVGVDTIIQKSDTLGNTCTSSGAGTKTVTIGAGTFLTSPEGLYLSTEYRYGGANGSYGAFATTAVDVTENWIEVDSHGLSNGTMIKFTSSTTLPAPLSSSTVYYALVVNANFFQVALTSGGAAIDLTTQGVGTHYLLIFDDYAYDYLITARPSAVTLTVTDTNRRLPLTAQKWEIHGQPKGEVLKLKSIVQDYDIIGNVGGDYQETKDVTGNV
jgi:hypothetical protein